jgi:hypothetical protein
LDNGCQETSFMGQSSAPDALRKNNVGLIEAQPVRIAARNAHNAR